MADAALPFQCADVGAACPAPGGVPAAASAPLVDWTQCEACASWIVHRLAHEDMRFVCADAGLVCLPHAGAEGSVPGTPEQEPPECGWTDDLLCGGPCTNLGCDGADFEFELGGLDDDGALLLPAA